MTHKIDHRAVTSSDGSFIYADATGNPQKPPIVFIHGLSLSCVVFDNIFSDAEFSSKYYLVRYDMRGHGRSVKPDEIEGYSSKLYADDFAAVCSAFGLHKPLFVGWSLGATVLADIATYLPKDYLSGAVYLGGLPYIGPSMYNIGTPTILGFLEGLFSEDIKLSNKTLIDFSDSLFLKPEEIPWEMKCKWIGMAVHQLPKHRTFVCSRPQVPDKLHELGAGGFPLLIISGTQDSQIKSDVVASDLKPYFTNMEVRMIEKGGSHAIHFENSAEVLSEIGTFMDKVHSK